MNIEQFQTVCQEFPAATQDIKWDNDLVFSVGQKMFAVASLEPPLRISFKVPDDDFEVLIQQQGIIPAPYMARAKWIQVQEEAGWNEQQLRLYLHKSYELVKQKLTKKLRTELGI